MTYAPAIVKVKGEYEIRKDDWNVLCDTLRERTFLLLPKMQPGMVFVIKDIGDSMVHPIVLAASDGDNIDGAEFVTLEERKGRWAVGPGHDGWEVVKPMSGKS